MRWYEQLDEKLRDYLPDLTVLAEEPLALALLQGGGEGRVCLQAEAGRLVPHWQESRQPAAQ